MVSIIIPTLNERESMERLLPELVTAVSDVSEVELVVIDDGSTDGTVSYLQNRVQHVPFKLHVISRHERGLATAVLRGFQEAHGDVLCVMDADLSHPPAVLTQLIHTVRDGADIAVGSRRISGGGVEEWPLIRKMYSYISTWFARPLSGGVHDPLSGFFVVRRRVIDGVTLTPIGYKILLEILVKGRYTQVVEVPYIFRNRDVGKSKLSFAIALQYYTHLGQLYWYTLTRGIFRRCITNVMVLFVAFALGVGGIEVLYRVKVEKYYYIFPKGLYVPHPTRCFVYAPNFNGEIHAREFTTPVSINSHGLPDKEYEYEKPFSVMRILAVGDSFVAQYPVGYEKSFLTILESRFQKEQRHVEIIAAGFNGYNTIQERIFLQEEGIRYAPDVVLAFFYINDLRDNVAFMDNPPTNCVDRAGRLIGKPYKQMGVWDKMGSYFRGVRFTYNKVRGLVKSSVSSKNQVAAESLGIYMPKLTGNAIRLYTTTVNEFVRMRDIVAGSGARFVVVLVPEKNAIEERERFLDEFQNVAKDIDLQNPTRNLANLLAKEDVEVIDLTSALLEYKKNHSDERLYFTLDNHWTVRGNEVAAETLYPYSTSLLKK